MPYKDIKELPDSIKKLPTEAQKIFLEAYNKVFDKLGDTNSFKVAWEVVKKKFKKVDNVWVTKGSVKISTFELETKDCIVSKADDGEYYLEGILSDTFKDSDGKAFTEEALINFAKQINDDGISGFITHSDWKDFCINNSHLEPDVFVAKAKKERNGILRVIKAVYEKGKLWIKAIIDKRYVKRVKSFNKMSLEAYIPKEYQNGDTYTNGYVLGLALDNNAINPRAKIARIA